MSETKTIISFIIIISAVILALWLVSIRVYSFHGNKIEKITINNKTFYAEVVSSPDKMQKGLGERKSLCQSCAMIFEFPQTGRYPFWMKDMHFPLDIIWISGGKVVYLEKNVSENFSGVITPPNDANQVLEINAGNIEKLGIKIGDKVISF